MVFRQIASAKNHRERYRNRHADKHFFQLKNPPIRSFFLLLHFQKQCIESLLMCFHRHSLPAKKLAQLNVQQIA